jgi:cell division protease FtsH
MVLPTEDKYSTTRNEMLDQLAYMLGGRAAEEMVFHDPTTGASNDIEKATQLARAMVMQYGMSDRVGAVRLGQGEGEVFLGRDMGHKRDYSEQMAETIDAEVRTFLETAHQEAYEILNENRDVLDRLVVELLDRETLDQDEVAEVFSDLRKRDTREVWLSSADRPVSDRGPVRSRRELTGENGQTAAGGSNGSGPDHLAAEEPVGGTTETEG